MVVTYRLESGDEIARIYRSTDNEGAVVIFGFPELFLEFVLHIELVGDDYSKATISDLCDLASETSFLSEAAVKNHLTHRSKNHMWPAKKDYWEMTQCM